RLRAGADPDGADAALVLAHRRPRARLAEGETARLAGCRALVDVSDGLAADLGHLASASGVGYRLDAVPVAEGATLDEALGGGEDYELVLATPDPEALVAAFAAAGLAPPLALGRCSADTAERTLAGAPVPPAGYEHPFTTA
ncbi:MAG TPA: AIR synthase-related protein, partial [Acidimicrobiales bacterium]|nr:AIR synthase-related protein [Acidimicrobiales bacterium]